MLSQTFKLGFAGLALTCWVTGLAVAGPLDRSSDGPRNNPAVDDMMRIPGVLNMYFEEAMDLLQAAGLNPRIKAIKRVMPRYEGREGKVVFQSPLPGGVAMIGSTVAITYYLPEGFELDLPEADEGYEDGEETGEAEATGDEGLAGDTGNEDLAGETGDEELTEEREFHGKNKKGRIKGLKVNDPRVKVSGRPVPQVKTPRIKGSRVKVSGRPVPQVKTPRIKGSRKSLPRTKGMQAITAPKSQGIKIMPKAKGIKAVIPPKAQGMKIMAPRTKGMQAITAPQSQGIKIMPRAKGTKAVIPRAQGK